MESSPVVSVIMPAYNAERFIKQAINSVQAQTFEDWELIVVDDCSTDGTVSVAEGLAHGDNRISVVRNGHNLGVSRTRNRGIDLSDGEFVALLDSDDYWDPRKLDKQLKLIRKEQADIAYCSYEIVDEQGSKKANDFIVPAIATYAGTLVKSVMSCSTVLIRRSSLGSRRFSSEVCHEDLVLWLDLLKSGCKAVGDEEVLAAYRVVSGSRTSNKLKSAVHRWDLFRRYLHLPLDTCIVLIVRYGWFAVRKYLPARGGGSS